MMNTLQLSKPYLRIIIARALGSVELKQYHVAFQGATNDKIFQYE